MSSGYLKNYRVVESLTPSPCNHLRTQIAVFADCASSSTVPLTFLPLCLGVGEGSAWKRPIPAGVCALSAEAEGGSLRNARGQRMSGRGFLAKVKVAPVESRDLTPEESRLVESWNHWQSEMVRVSVPA